MNMVDFLKLLKEDERTKGAVIVGEIGGTMEEEVAAYIETEFGSRQ